MPFTRCPYCHKVQQVVANLVLKDIGCMNAKCGKSFTATEYRMHSGPISRLIFAFFIAFSVFLLGRWLWFHSAWLASQFM